MIPQAIGSSISFHSGTAALASSAIPACRSVAPSAPPAAITRMISPASTIDSRIVLRILSALLGPLAWQASSTSDAAAESVSARFLSPTTWIPCTSQGERPQSDDSRAESALIRITGSRIGSSDQISGGSPAPVSLSAVIPGTAAESSTAAAAERRSGMAHLRSAQRA